MAPSFSAPISPGNGFNRLYGNWLPYLSRVPVQMQAEFIEAILNAYLVRHPPDEEGLVHVDMIRLEVEAFKL